ncbi:HEAT repeat domain-containing protein [Nostoc sp. PCC 9305]|uniref:HEAT repeat domain-containing protein n=1 Tax=Nostoc sp. PCC 9305 TaxID=296636 RepID=UPI0039C614C1
MNSRRNSSPVSITSGERLKAVPKLATFVEQIERFTSVDDPEAFWQCEPYFRELLQSNFLKDVLNYEMARFVDDETYSPDGTSEVEMLILRSENFSLVMKLLDPSAILTNYIYSISQHYMVGIVDFSGSGVATLDTFEQPNPDPIEIFDRKKRVVDKGSRILESGDVGLFRAPVDIFRVRPPEKPLILVVFTSKTVAPLLWEYDSSTLFPTRAISADFLSSRLEYTAWMLSELGDDTSIPALKTLLEHEDHYVRWAAIRSVARLDFTQGVNLLHTALEDPHPHIRNAARRSLDKLPA